MGYYYKRTEFSPYCLYTVGNDNADGKWQPESDHEITEEAAKRVHYLNGGNDAELLEALKLIVSNPFTKDYMRQRTLKELQEIAKQAIKNTD